jgi:hypothetical protein
MDANRLKSISRNMLDVLQTDPRNYRNFGIYWWPVKRVLKRLYTRDNLYMLGDYEDEEVAAMVPVGLNLDDLMQAALEEYGRNATFNLNSAQVANTEGEPVTIFDEDAGI